MASGFFLLLLGLSGCSEQAWNNPHGVLGGLFSPSPDTDKSAESSPEVPGDTPLRSSSSPQSTGQSQPTFGRLDPPAFSHVVPFPEGDGLYLQWRPVENVTDYLVYNGPKLVGDVATNRIRINGLLPCTRYRLRIFSSDGTKVSKNSLLVRVHTRGCLSVPR